jgi:hypothetical protein
MARPIPDANLDELQAALAQSRGDASVGQIAEALGNRLTRRTLQYRVRALVGAGRLRLTGDGRPARYHLARAGDATSDETSPGHRKAKLSLPLSGGR